MSSNTGMLARMSNLAKSDIEILKAKWKCKQRNGENGLVLELPPEGVIEYSPLTNEPFKIYSVFQRHLQPNELVVRIEMNVPMCVVGNYCFPENLTGAAGEFALKILKACLLKYGITILSSYHGNSFSMDESSERDFSVQSVTQSYYSKCNSEADAMATVDAFIDRANLVNAGRKSSENIIVKSENGTAQFTTSDFLITAYVVGAPTSDAYANLSSQEVQDSIDAVEKNIVRVDITLNDTCLRNKRADNLFYWLQCDLDVDIYDGLDSEDNGPCSLTLCILYEYFKFNLRTDCPSKEEMEQLNPTEQRVAQFHINGNNVRKPPLIQSKEEYRYMKELFMNKLGIDITIPWAVQSTKLSPYLADLNIYRPKRGLARHCFSKLTVPDLIKELDRIIQKLS